MAPAADRHGRRGVLLACVYLLACSAMVPSPALARRGRLQKTETRKSNVLDVDLVAQEDAFPPLTLEGGTMFGIALHGTQMHW